MTIGKLYLVVLASMFVLPASAQTGGDGTIKKCQDADGNWHYGDHAAFECAQSARITEIDQDGDKVGEIEAPPTQEELDARQRAEEQTTEQEAADAVQKRLDQRLLITYENSDSILQTRDALLAAIDSAVEADRILRERLVGELARLEASSEENAAKTAESIRLQIEDFDEAIRDRLAKRKVAENKYTAEHKRYKELTGN